MTLFTNIETPKIHMKLEDIPNNALDNQCNPEKSEHKWRFHKARLILHSTVMFAKMASNCPLNAYLCTPRLACLLNANLYTPRLA